MGAIAVKKGRFDVVLKAVIIYDDFDSATRATALLERVAIRADEGIKLDIRPWRFDILKQPTVLALTVAAAANADLIVLALRRTRSATAELLGWLKNWAEHRQIKDAAMMALCSGKTQAPSVFWNELKTFAAVNGLTVLDGHNV